MILKINHFLLYRINIYKEIVKLYITLDQHNTNLIKEWIINNQKYYKSNIFT
jgi:hypothetical protein